MHNLPKFFQQLHDKNSARSSQGICFFLSPPFFFGSEKLFFLEHIQERIDLPGADIFSQFRTYIFDDLVSMLGSLIEKYHGIEFDQVVDFDAVHGYNWEKYLYMSFHNISKSDMWLIWE